MFGFKPVRGNDWHTKMADLRRLREDANEAIQFIPGKKNDIEHMYQFELERVHGAIVGGAVSEFQRSLKQYQNQRSTFEQYKQAERKRFDTLRVSQERTAIIARVREIASSSENRDKIKDLKDFYTELMDGDLNRQRAAAEVYQELGEMNLPGNDAHGGRLATNVGELTVKAKQQLAELRTTPDLERKGREVDNALGDLLSKHEQLRAAGLALGSDPANVIVGGGSELAKNYRMLGVKDGQLEIRAPDDWRVTGFYMENKAELQQEWTNALQGNSEVSHE